MSYAQSRTMIEDLPDLDEMDQSMLSGNMGMQGDMDPNGGGLPPHVAAKYGKFIRQQHQVPPESGMGGAPHPHQQHPQRPQHSPGHDPRDHVPHGQPIEMPGQQGPTWNTNISCIEISNHVQGCPICSRFYNNDKSVYIIAIVVLLIVCLLLLKRVLNV